MTEGATKAGDDARFSSFLDLVGMRYYSQHLPERYKRALEVLHTSIAEEVHQLGHTGSVYLFSDCAYLESRTFDRLVNFLESLRWTLALDGFYFKAAVAACPLEEVSARSRLEGLLQATAEANLDGVQGHSFGASVVELYAAQEALKGIGISILKDGSRLRRTIPRSTLGRRVVRSCFVAGDGRTELKEFDDLKLRRELSEDNGLRVLQRFLKEFAIAKASSRKLGRLFVPYLVTFVQSVDGDALGEAGGAAHALRVSVFSGEFERLFGNVPGTEAVYFSFLSRVRQRDSKAKKLIYEGIKAFLKSHPLLLRKIDNVPPGVLDPVVRRELLEELSGDLLGTSAEIRRTLEELERLIAANTARLEMAKQLQKKGCYNPRTRDKWREQDVGWAIRHYGLDAPEGQVRGS